MESYLSNTSFEYGRKLASCKDEDRVVISGISGTYPSCENIAELAEALFEGKDLITGESFITRILSTPRKLKISRNNFRYTRVEIQRRKRKKC